MSGEVKEKILGTPEILYIPVSIVGSIKETTVTPPGEEFSLGLDRGVKPSKLGPLQEKDTLKCGVQGLSFA